MNKQTSFDEAGILFGKRILLTRSKKQLSKSSGIFSKFGAEVIEFPTIDIRALPFTGLIEKTIKNITDFKWIVFTSVNAVEIFFHYLHICNIETDILGRIKIAAIGKETARSLESNGVSISLMPSTYTSEGAVEEFQKVKDQIKNEKILIPTSAIARDIIDDALKNLGAESTKLSVYENIIPEYSTDEVNNVFSEKVDFVTFTSPSTLINFLEILKKHGLDKIIPEIHGVSIGPATTNAAIENNVKILVEANPSTMEGMVNSLIRYLNEK